MSAFVAWLVRDLYVMMQTNWAPGKVTSFLLFPGLVCVLATPWWIRRRLRRLAARILAYGCSDCPNCGYCLRGLPSPHACPECGMTYDVHALNALWSQWAKRQLGST